MSDHSPQPSDADSRDCVDVIVDLHKNNTPQPIPPALLKLLEAEREKIARWSKQTGQQPPRADGPENS